MPQETLYYRITLHDAQNASAHFNPYEIGLTKRVDWLTELWINPLSGESRTRTLLREIAMQGDSGKTFLRALRSEIDQRKRLVKEAKMLNTLEALSHEITRHAGRF